MYGCPYSHINDLSHSHLQPIQCSKFAPHACLWAVGGNWSTCREPRPQCIIVQFIANHFSFGHLILAISTQISNQAATEVYTTKPINWNFAHSAHISQYILLFVNYYCKLMLSWHIMLSLEYFCLCMFYTGRPLMPSKERCFPRLYIS